LYLVCVFCCTVSFVSICQVIGCDDHLQNYLDCGRWGICLYSIKPNHPSDRSHATGYRECY